MVILSPGQSYAQDIDFSDELSELSENKPSNSDTSTTINDTYDWSKDLSVLEDDNKKTQSENVSKKIEDIKQQCEFARNPPPPPLKLLTFSCRFDDCSKDKAVRICEERGHRYNTAKGDACWEGLVDTIRADSRANAEKQRLNKKRREASAKRHRQEMLTYCDANQSTLERNILPPTYYPSWGYNDERIFELADTALDGQINASLAALKMEQEAEALKEKNQKAAEEKVWRDELAAEIAEREAIRREYCRVKISAGGCPCNCADMCVSPPSVPGFPQVCEK